MERGCDGASHLPYMHTGLFSFFKMCIENVFFFKGWGGAFKSNSLTQAYVHNQCVGPGYHQRTAHRRLNQNNNGSILQGNLQAIVLEYPRNHPENDENKWEHWKEK